jgi:tape measure domain-containing protein
VAADSLRFKVEADASEVNKALQDALNDVAGADRALNKLLGGTVEKFIDVSVRVNSKGVKELVAVEKQRLTAADKIISLQRKSEELQAGSLTSLRQQYNRQKQLRDSIAQYREIVVASGASVRVINKEWEIASRKVSEVGRQLAEANASGFWDKVKVSFRAQGLVDFLDGLAGITQGLQAASIAIGQFVSGINTVIKSAADLQSFGLAFEAIGTGSAGANLALQESQRIALGLGTNINTVQDSFKQLSPVILNTGGSIQDVSSVVEALSSRFAAFGISGDRARRVTNGVIQAFAKGKLQAEELTQQISEADPAFKSDLANAIGVSVAELERLVKAGGITGKVLLENIPKLSKSALLFGKLGDSAIDAANSLAEGNVTIDQVRTQFGNLNELNLRNLATAFEPVINVFIKLQAIVTDFFSRLSQVSNIESIGQILANFGAAGGRAVQAFLSLVEAVVLLINAIAPLIEKLTSVPGVLEAVGLAILGKFLKPLQSGVKVIGGLGGAVTKYISDIQSALGGAASGIGQYASAAKSAGEGTSTLSDAAKAGAAATKNVGDAAKGTNTAIGALGQNVQQAAKVINDYQSGTSKYVRSAEAAKIASSNLLRSIANIAGFPRIVSKETLAGLRELAKKDPATSMALLRNAIGATRRELAGLDKGGAQAIALKTNLNELKAAMVDVVASSKEAKKGADGLGASKESLSAKTSLLNRGLQASKAALSPLGSLFNGVAAGARGLLAALGPIGIALGVLAVFQQAYNNAAQKSNTIYRESETSLKAIDSAITDLTGKTQDLEQPISGLGLAWLEFSLVVKESVDAVKSLLDSLAPSSDAAAGGADNAANAFDRFAKVLAGAGFGALAGSVFGPVGTAIGAVTGTLITLAATGDATEAQLKQLALEFKAVENASARETVAISRLSAALVTGANDAAKTKDEIAKLKKELEAKTNAGAPQEEINKLTEQILQKQNQLNASSAKLGASYGLISTQVAKTEAALTQLKAKQEEATIAAGKFPEGYANVRPELVQLFNLQKNLNANIGLQQTLQDRVREGLIDATDAQQRLVLAAQEEKTVREQIAAIQRELQGKGVDIQGAQQDPQLQAAIAAAAQYESQLQQLDEAVKQLEADLKAQKIAKDEAARATGLLTSEEKEYATTISSVSDEISRLKQLLEEELDPGLKPEKWREVNAEIAIAQVNLQRLKDSAEGLQALFTATTIRIGIDTGALADSVENAKRIVSSLETAEALINVRAPELPSVIANLVQARQNLDDINGYVATVTVKVIEQGLSTGALRETVGVLDQQLKALGAQSVSIPIDSPGIDEVLTKIEEVNQRKELGTLTNDQLEERSIQNQLKRLDIIENKQKNKIDNEIKGRKTADAAAERSAQAEIQQIQAASEARRAATQQQIQLIQQALQAARTASESRLRFLDQEAAKIDANNNRLQAGYAAQIRSLQGLTKAEKEQQAIKEKELKFQAAFGKTEEEKLDARAQLERLAREKAIASVQEKARKAAEQAAADREAIEQRRAAEQEAIRRDEEESARRIAAIEEEARAKEQADKLEIKKIEEGIRAQKAQTAELELEGAKKNLQFEAERQKLQERADELRLKRLEAEEEVIDYLLAKRKEAEEVGDLEKAAEINKEIAGISEGVANTAASFGEGTSEASDALSSVGAPAAEFVAGQLYNAAEAATQIGNKIRALDGLTVRINIAGIPGLWTGGPTEAGKVYQVNELGQEGFLSAGGTLRPINKPKNALWRAPSAGTVIPAHIMSALDAPKTGVKANIPGASVAAASGASSQMTKALQSSLSANIRSGRAINELASVQAQQALQIGKLSSAVNTLAAKDWNVHVKVRSNDNDFVLDALRHGL